MRLDRFQFYILPVGAALPVKRLAGATTLLSRGRLGHVDVTATVISGGTAAGDAVVV